MDPAIDFANLMSRFDTVLIGRRTFEHMLTAVQGVMPGMTTIVASKTVESGAYPGVAIWSRDVE
jgi:dihydrofolate reductase